VAKIFLDQLSRIIDRTTSGRVGSVRVECKHFFSGAAVYASGRICASLTPVGFAIKLPKESRDILLKRRGVKPLRYFAKGPVKKEYVVLPKALSGDPNSLRGLLEISIAYVLHPSRGSRRRVLRGHDDDLHSRPQPGSRRRLEPGRLDIPVMTSEGRERQIGRGPLTAGVGRTDEECRRLEDRGSRVTRRDHATSGYRRVRRGRRAYNRAHPGQLTRGESVLQLSVAQVLGDSQRC